MEKQNLLNSYFNYIPLFTSIIAKYKRHYNFNDEIFNDLLQDSYLFYVDAIRNYKPSNNTRLETYIYKSFDYYVIAKLKEYCNPLTGLKMKSLNSQINITISIDSKIPFKNNITENKDVFDKDDEDINLEQLIAYEDYLVNSVEDKIINEVIFNSILSKIKDILDEREYKIFVKYFVYGETITKIAKELKISGERVRQLKNRIIDKIKREKLF